jgi:hypothetical protein
MIADKKGVSVSAANPTAEPGHRPLLPPCASAHARGSSQSAADLLGKASAPRQLLLHCSNTVHPWTYAHAPYLHPCRQLLLRCSTSCIPAVGCRVKPTTRASRGMSEFSSVGGRLYRVRALRPACGPMAMRYWMDAACRWSRLEPASKRKTTLVSLWDAAIDAVSGYQAVANASPSSSRRTRYPTRNRSRPDTDCWS